MKILYLSANVNVIGGIERYNNEMINSLKMKNIDLIHVERKNFFFSKFAFSIYFFYILLFKKVDHIICGHINYIPLAFIAKFFLKKSFTVNLYGIEIINLKKRRRFHRFILNYANYIITISNYSKRLILDINLKLLNKIFIIESTFDHNKFLIKEDSFIKNNLKLNDHKIILMLSRLSDIEQKGHHRVIKALQSVLIKFPKTKLLIAGSGSDVRVNNLLRENKNLINNILFIGPIKNEELCDTYNSADLFILPSINEGFAIVFLEALSCGIPVIGSNSYGCEIIKQKELGEIVDPNNINDISNKIIYLLSKNLKKNIQYRKNLREKSYKYFGKKNWDNKIKIYINNILPQ